MDNIFEQIYNLFIGLLNDLGNGYSLDKSNLSQIWELYHVAHLLQSAHVTDGDIIYIDDHYYKPLIKTNQIEIKRNK